MKLFTLCLLIWCIFSVCCFVGRWNPIYDPLPTITAGQGKSLPKAVSGAVDAIKRKL